MIQQPALLCWSPGKLLLERGVRACGAAGLVGGEVALPSSEGTACTPPVSARAEAASLTFRGASPQQLPLLPVPTGAATSDRPHSLPLLRLVQLRPPGMSRDVQEERDDQLALEYTSCSRLLDQTLPRLNTFEIPAGLHSCNLSFQAAPSAAKNISIFD